MKKQNKQGSILAQILLLPKAEQLKVMEAFTLWASLKGLDMKKLQSDAGALEEALGQFISEVQAQQAQKAKHGAKLNYIKQLSHKCGPNEELVYYKKGGHLGCGCRKKEDGGKIKSETPVEKFRNNKKSIIKLECGSKLKKHYNGGSLNDIPFYQAGTNKNGITILPEVVVTGKDHRPRFDRRISNIGPGYKVISDVIFNEYNNGEYMGDFSPIIGGRSIYITPTQNDTIYMTPDTEGGAFNNPNINWIDYPHGFMPVPSNRNSQNKNRKFFYRAIKKGRVGSYDKNDTKKAFKRAQKGN